MSIFSSLPMTGFRIILFASFAAIFLLIFLAILAASIGIEHKKYKLAAVLLSKFGADEAAAFRPDHIIYLLIRSGDYKKARRWIDRALLKNPVPEYIALDAWLLAIEGNWKDVQTQVDAFAALCKVNAHQERADRQAMLDKSVPAFTAAAQSRKHAQFLSIPVIENLEVSLGFVAYKIRTVLGILLAIIIGYVTYTLMS